MNDRYIHTHILPAIDDGAKSEKIAFPWPSQAVEQGIRTLELI
ncbi:hypothetical protein [Oceanobacillus sp. J11TS1]|nr:hypothetical protein [Oceanobacillus sp. J11TS1]GIO23439.1 hypothetical protein J11TS1_20200 [Oceanobacillus sp. J11TS1]